MLSSVQTDAALLANTPTFFGVTICVRLHGMLHIVVRG